MNNRESYFRAKPEAEVNAFTHDTIPEPDYYRPRNSPAVQKGIPRWIFAAAFLLTVLIILAMSAKAQGYRERIPNVYHVHKITPAAAVMTCDQGTPTASKSDEIPGGLLISCR